MDESYDPISENKYSSKINSAMLVNLTLQKEWDKFSENYKKGKLLSAKTNLEIIWIYLGGEKGVKGSESEKEYIKLENDLLNDGTLVDNLNVKGFSSPKEEDIKKYGNQRAKLMELALFLRRLHNEQGKGTAYDDDSDDYMD